MGSLQIHILTSSLPPLQTTWKGTNSNGVSTNGVTANFMSFDRGTFCAPSLTYFVMPKSARAYLFPQSVKISYFCSGHTSVDPLSFVRTQYLPLYESGGGKHT